MKTRNRVEHNQQTPNKEALSHKFVRTGMHFDITNASVVFGRMFVQRTHSHIAVRMFCVCYIV